jgi:hypothetical protein
MFTTVTAVEECDATEVSWQQFGLAHNFLQQMLTVLLMM